jgi:3,4-dihydroxy 2-butanone 4-phosphate synthase/GTP cyclohydrolase II
MAQIGGVLRRAGHTEAGCDLARMAGYSASSAIVEIMNEDGSMARRPDLEVFAKKHGLKIGTIADLIHYRIANEHTVERTDSNVLQTQYGEFNVHTYKDSLSGSTHLAFVKGEIKADECCLVRVHIPNTIRDTCEVFNAGRTSWSFGSALKRIYEEGKGVAVLLSEEDYGQNMAHNLAAAIGSPGDTQPTSRPGSDLTIGTGSQILRDLGVGKMELLSYPARFNAISGFDLEVVNFVEFERQD